MNCEFLFGKCFHTINIVHQEFYMTFSYLKYLKIDFSFLKYNFGSSISKIHYPKSLKHYMNYFFFCKMLLKQRWGNKLHLRIKEEKSYLRKEYIYIL